MDKKVIEIYCNYGVLAAEKRNAYTYGNPHSHAVCSDKIIVEIPDGWTLFESNSGRTMVEAPWGWPYDINEVLQGDECPCFYALDPDQKGHRAYLNILSQ